jgi:hypothetical protein
MNKLEKTLVYKLIVRSAGNHNNRFAGVGGKKAELEDCIEVFNRGVFRAKNYGVDEEHMLIKAGWARLKSYLWLLRNGYPKVASDILAVEDFDILPKGHRMYSKHKTYHFEPYNFFEKELDI